MLIRIEAPHFVAALELGGRAAPIVRYMRTWDEARIRRYCAAKGWRVEAYPDADDFG